MLYKLLLVSPLVLYIVIRVLEVMYMNREYHALQDVVVTLVVVAVGIYMARTRRDKEDFDEH